MLAMRACTNKCESGEYEARSESTCTLAGNGVVLVEALAVPWKRAETAKGWSSTLTVSCNPPLFVLVLARISTRSQIGLVQVSVLGADKSASVISSWRVSTQATLLFRCQCLLCLLFPFPFNVSIPTIIRNLLVQMEMFNSCMLYQTI